MSNTAFKLLGIVLLAGSLAAGWVWMEKEQFYQQTLSVGADGLDFTVEPGTSLRSIAQSLKQHGILDDAQYLEWEARRQGRAHLIKAGEYHIAPGTTPLQLLDLLVSGQVVQHRLTLIEGWRFTDIRAALAATPWLENTIQDLDDSEIMRRIGADYHHPEGLFLADTYLFPSSSSDIEFLRRAYRAMMTLLEREWQARAADLPYENPYQALIMASIIEKETGQPEERAEIAGVFVRRLKKNMYLQTDPTVIYAMGDSYDGNIRRRDLRLDNPYNTYRYKGLPPTPIAIPGAAAIHAALHPKPGDTLYFVARGNGRHAFSTTLAEHQRAVRRYQLGGD